MCPMIAASQELTAFLVIIPNAQFHGRPVCERCLANPWSRSLCLAPPHNSHWWSPSPWHALGLQSQSPTESHSHKVPTSHLHVICHLEKVQCRRFWRKLLKTVYRAQDSFKTRSRLTCDRNGAGAKATFTLCATTAEGWLVPCSVESILEMEEIVLPECSAPHNMFSCARMSAKVWILSCADEQSAFGPRIQNDQNSLYHIIVTELLSKY